MDQLNTYIEAYIRASDRTRSIYLVIVAFSVVCLAAFLNSASFGWKTARLKEARLVYAYLCSVSPKSNEVVIPLEQTERDGAISLVRQMHIKTLEESRTMLAEAEKRVADANAIQIPLFGLSFDINDLGLVSGVSLVLLLLLLKYALTREIANLDMAAAKARAIGEIRYAYEILTTGEVLHLPQTLQSSLSGRIKEPLLDVPLLLLFFPVLCYAVVWANDLQTVWIGMMHSYAYTLFIVWFEFVALVLMSAIARSCFRIIRSTRTIWSGLHAEANSINNAKA